MIEESFFLEDCEVQVIIVDEEYNIERIGNVLQNLGCDYSQIVVTYNKIKEHKYNIGFTYTNFLKKKSVILIGLQDDKYQLINTIAHESAHLSYNIFKLKHLKQDGEIMCYLLGTIVQIIYEICEKHKII